MRFSTRTFLTTLLVFLGFLSVATAQQIKMPFGDLQHDVTQDVEIVSDSFTVSQDKGSAEFLGNVVVGQGALRLSAGKIVVEYDPDNGQENGKIDHLIATDNVTLVSGSEAAEADKATYSIADANILLEGNVILTQGKNAISGQKVIIDLNDGSARVEGRVKTIFNTGAKK